jgi:hypothetical protein
MAIVVSVSALFWDSMTMCHAASDDPLPPQYVIELKLAEVDSHGKEQILSRPVLATIEGRPAHVSVGQTVPTPGGLKMENPWQTGLQVTVTVLRKDGRLYLDAATEVTSAPIQREERLHLVKIGARMLEKVRLGDKISGEMPADAQGRKLCWEARVSDARDYEKIKTQRPAATPATVSATPPCPAPTAATAKSTPVLAEKWSSVKSHPSP